MYAGKPIIGIVGGIGSGKSTIARYFGELGCLVIDSDEQVRAAYDDPAIRAQLADWWGRSIFSADGNVDRRALGRMVFADQGQRKRLEGLVHPWIAARREETMALAGGDDKICAFVWDAPLLMEAGLHKQCDTVLFVDTPREMRIGRVVRTRGWDEAELNRRENLQTPLDKKREISEHVIYNASDAEAARDQVRQMLSRILSKYSVPADGKKNS